MPPAKHLSQPRDPVHASSSVRPLASWPLPRFEPAQPTHPTPPRDPTPPSALPLPVRSTPRSPPSRIASPATLCMQPVQSFFSRRGSSLGLSPHNPPTQLLQRDPTPPSFFLSCIRILLPGRDRTIPARRRVSRRLDRRRPSLRLTRIHLPRPPLRGSTAHQPALPNTPTADGTPPTPRTGGRAVRRTSGAPSKPASRTLAASSSARACAAAPASHSDRPSREARCNVTAT